ncbi:MAG TPA: hypothetical protein VNT60_05150, partial [Deinococcales bacterium]|nr:hypothetical protein [Deinococcales bacterium]
MLVPYSWLQELVPGLPAARDLEPVLARLGLPVEDIYDVPSPPPGVVFGVATSARPLEGTALTVLEVDVGGRSVSIVTGAPNARAGIGLAVALPGTLLPTDEGRGADGLGLEVAVRT